MEGMLRRLQIGNITPGIGTQTDDKFVKSAVLVHSGPNGEKVTFQSADGEISFDEARIKQIVENHNKKILELAKGYNGIENMPIGAYPPILDQHENDSSNRVIGRLASLLTFEKRNVPGVGDNVACAMADVTFLGKDTIDRVKDGRIYSLSIGIDESTNTLVETSTVITPAAPGAMLLKKSNIKNGEFQMGNEKINQKLSKLMSIKKDIAALSSKIIVANSNIRTTKKESEVDYKLHELMRSKKLTVAEYKQINVKELASLDNKAMKIMLNHYSIREDVIASGQRGSTDSVDFSSIGKNMEKNDINRLKAEVKGDLKKLNKNLAFKDDPDADKDHGDTHQMAEEIHQGSDPHSVPGQAGYEQQLKHLKAWHGTHLEHHLTMSKHLAAGDINSAKEHHDMMLKHCMEAHDHFAGVGKVDSGEEGVKHMEMGDVKSEDYKKSMDYLQQQIDEVNTQISRIAGIVNELIDVEKEEGEEFAHEAETHKGLEVEKTEDEKKLEGEIKGDITGKKPVDESAVEKK